MWPRRAIDGTEVPLVAPVVRTAALDPVGRLWVSFVVPYTYVFDGLGEKVRDGAVPGGRPRRAEQPELPVGRHACS